MSCKPNESFYSSKAQKSTYGHTYLVKTTATGKNSRPSGHGRPWNPNKPTTKASKVAGIGAEEAKEIGVMGPTRTKRRMTTQNSNRTRKITKLSRTISRNSQRVTTNMGLLSTEKGTAIRGILRCSKATTPQRREAAKMATKGRTTHRNLVRILRRLEVERKVVTTTTREAAVLEVGAVGSVVDAPEEEEEEGAEAAARERQIATKSQDDGNFLKVQWLPYWSHPTLLATCYNRSFLMGDYVFK